MSQIFLPAPAGVHPQGIWTTAVATARAAMASADVTAENVAAIGITNQRDRILWDRTTGKPIAMQSYRQDRRTHDTCAALTRAATSGWSTSAPACCTILSATKIAWMFDHVDGARAAAEAGKLAFGTVDTYLLWLASRRCHQRVAHAAARYPHRAVVPSCSRCSASRHR